MSGLEAVEIQVAGTDAETIVPGGLAASVDHEGLGAKTQKDSQLVPGAVPDARAFLRDDHAVRERFDRFATLMDGFETPYGLELLATVHWVVARLGAASVAEAIQKTHGWNDRKRQFTEKQIGLAYRTLEFRNAVSHLNEVNWPAVAATDWRNAKVKHGKQG